MGGETSVSQLISQTLRYLASDIAEINKRVMDNAANLGILLGERRTGVSARSRATAP
jgi:hypothetical protein